MEYVKSKHSFNIFEGKNIERILKFAVINFAVGIVIVFTLQLITEFFGQSEHIRWIVTLATLLAAQVFLLSWYEEWRGCYTRVERSTPGA